MELRPRVLCVSVSAETRQRVGALLTQAGLEARFCEPDSAELVLRDPQPAVLLLEVGGVDTLASRIAPLRAKLGCPIVAIANTFDEGARCAALAAGADDVASLSQSGDELVARIRTRLRPSAAPSEPDNAPTAEILLELTRTLVSSLDIQEILYILVSRIAAFIDVERVSIVLAPDDSNAGYVVAASDDQTLQNLRIDLGKYPEIRHALKTRRSITIDDVDHHPLLDQVRRSVSDAGLSALTLVPFVCEDQALGVLFVRARTRRGALSRQQLGFCEVLANATAIALRNARILQELREETQRDSHARVEIEKRLSVLKRYADLLASAADGLAAFDLDGRLLFANPSAHAIVGYASDQYLGRSLLELIGPEELRNIAKLRQKLTNGEYPHDVDIDIVHRSGRRIVINGSFSPLAGTEGAVLLSFRDVTEERKTRDELVHTRNFLQSLIDASVDAIVAADMKGTIILFNKGAQQLYGYRSQDAIGKMNATTLYPGEGAREVMRMLRSKNNGGVGRLEPVRIEAVDARGSIFPISLTAAIIYEDGKETATFGIFTDLRERVRVEQQLAQAQEKLALSEKQALLAELAGATAHELNQPLTSVMGYAELLLRKLSPETPMRRGAEVIHSEAQRMAEIVRKIGKLTRYETKSYVGDQRILDLDRASGDDAEGPEKSEP